MTRLLIMLSLFLAPAQAFAQRGVTTFEPIRYEYIFQMAKTVCVRMESQPATQVGPLFLEIQNRFKLSNAELTTLLNYCLMYVEGRTHA